jgi:glucose-6-phosphate isomerase
MTFHLDPAIDSIPVSDQLLSISQRIATKDASVWGASTEAAFRLGWVDLAEKSRSLLPQLDSIAAAARESKIEEIVLSGMGGSSLAPEVIAKTYRGSGVRPLVILDSTEPHFVKSRLGRDLSKTLFFVSSKSGTTIETNSHLALIEELLSAQGLDQRNHIVVITDPGSPLALRAEAHGWRVILGDPEVGGRFSALSAFGLAPAALIGVDPSLLIDDAAEMIEDIHGPAVKIATFLSQHRYLYFSDSQGVLPGLADWIEQLIAESTGKHGTGLLPIAIDSSPGTKKVATIDLSTLIDAPLGAHFILWEWVTALLGYIFGVDPFDQPDVQATKTQTLEVLGNAPHSRIETLFTPLQEIREEITSELPGREYLAICAFLDPIRDSKIASLRLLLEKALQIPVTFGWGPRFLHSTGQFHKGGPKSGIFLSLTIECDEVLPVPGKNYDFARLILAQAEGDRRALMESGNPVISVHLKGEADVEKLLARFS